jgi:amidohydrolase
MFGYRAGRSSIRREDLSERVMTSAPVHRDPEIASLVEAATAPSVALRRQLHAFPEVMFEERRTAATIVETLGALGIPFVDGLAGGTGVLAHLEGGDGEPIALRADIDALPIEERTDVPWKSSIPGRMHACGHDGHVAVLLGAARVLREISKRRGLPRPVTLVFQPAEEGGGGGRMMVEDGALDGSRIGPAVARIYGLHGWPMLGLGQVATRPGPMLAASDAFEVVVEGVGGHAALPHLLRNPLLAAGAIAASLPTLPAIVASATDSAVVTPTLLRAGDAFNVIPPSARIAGTIRTLREQTRERLHRAFAERCEGLAAAYGCTAKVEIRGGYPVTVNDPETCGRFDAAMLAALGGDRVEQVSEPTMGSEDFSYYGQHVPACFYLLGLQAEGASAVPPLHSPHFDFVDDALPTGIAAMASLALEG